MLEKASHFLPDVYIPDLEDSVGDNDKTDARKIVSENIRLFKESDKLIIPRVNSLESGLFEDDIAALISKGINGVSVGKIYDTEDIVQIDKIKSPFSKPAEIAEDFGKTCVILGGFWIMLSNVRSLPFLSTT